MNPNTNNVELVRIAILVTNKLRSAMQQKGVQRGSIIKAFEQTAVKEGFISPEAAKELEWLIWLSIEVEDEINSGKGKQRPITDSELNRARELERLINQGARDIA